MVHQFTRSGVYGVILRDSKIFLTRKKAGPYLGRWDFPGGGIEFGETPEETLKRELLEEAAMKGDQLELIGAVSCSGEHKTAEDHYRYHHIGIIYRVGRYEIDPALIPEEEGLWFPLDSLEEEQITPFVQQILRARHLPESSTVK